VASFRDGAKAVQAATLACNLTGWKDPRKIGTLAAACAETGDFASAVKWQSQFLEQSHLSGGAETDAKERLVLYQAHQPFHGNH